MHAGTLARSLLALSCALGAARAGRAGEARREPISHGAQFVARSCSCGGVARPGIFAHPPWDGAWREFARGTTIGHKKLDRFDDVTATKVRLTIAKARAAPMICELGLFRAPHK
jgi:hypothetical protein